jgi:hypothetical protein
MFLSISSTEIYSMRSKSWQPELIFCGTNTVLHLSIIAHLNHPYNKQQNSEEENKFQLRFTTWIILKLGQTRVDIIVGLLIVKNHW